MFSDRRALMCPVTLLVYAMLNGRDQSVDDKFQAASVAISVGEVCRGRLDERRETDVSPENK